MPDNEEKAKDKNPDETASKTDPPLVLQLTPTLEGYLNTFPASMASEPIVVGSYDGAVLSAGNIRTVFPDYRFQFDDELIELRRRVAQQAAALTEEKISGKVQKERNEALEAAMAELKAKEEVGFLLNRVNPEAQRELLANESFRKCFLEAGESQAFVIAIDIRRSTELMLKARTPEAFAKFITTLCADLMKIVTESYGVVDKFTGDGVLAFFPNFYTGEDAAYYAVSVADKCHASFKEHYQGFRRSFTSVLTEIGLGIGIDYGAVHIVQIAGGLTVVGSPVVYACRLSGAPGGITLMNQPAYEVVSDRFGARCFIDEKDIEIKHEGRMLAYEVRLNGRDSSVKVPEWLVRSRQK